MLSLRYYLLRCLLLPDGFCFCFLFLTWSLIPYGLENAIMVHFPHLVLSQHEPVYVGSAASKAAGPC